MFFDNYRRRRRETLVREAAARNGLGDVRVSEVEPHQNLNETQSIHTWRQRRGGPEAGNNAAPQRNSVTDEEVIMDEEEARIFGRMKLSILKYLLLMVRIYKGIFRDVRRKFNNQSVTFSFIWSVVIVLVLGVSFFSVFGWILSVFIQWGFGEASDFRSMLVSLAILHFPLFNKQYYLTRI